MAQQVISFGGGIYSKYLCVRSETSAAIWATSPASEIAFSNLSHKVHFPLNGRRCFNFTQICVPVTVC